MARFGVLGFLMGTLVLAAPLSGDVGDRTAGLTGEWLERPVSLVIRGAPLSGVLQTVGDLTGREFVMESELSYPVSFEMSKMSARRTLQVIGDSQSLIYRQEGPTVYVEQVLPPRVGATAAGSAK